VNNEDQRSKPLWAFVCFGMSDYEGLRTIKLNNCFFLFLPDKSESIEKEKLVIDTESGYQIEFNI